MLAGLEPRDRYYFFTWKRTTGPGRPSPFLELMSCIYNYYGLHINILCDVFSVSGASFDNERDRRTHDGGHA